MQTPAALDLVKITAQPPHRTKLGALWLSMALLVLAHGLPTSGQTFQKRTGLTFGITSTNWQTQVSAGFLFHLSDHWASFQTFDLGGGLAASQSQAALLFELDESTRLGFLLGPEVAVYQESPTLDDKIVYVNAATGAFLWLDMPPRLSILAFAEYIETAAPTPRWKLAVRVALWLRE